ncbi:MAG TPA: inosine/xanthosine triphosphatase [Candidatus Thermoplasmatota archaeon]|nr:inosine/xanthosine triphosphatase [Candidatus Thermoplasmatota archaeon]
MRTCLGGTFEPFHAGHEALLRAACAGSAEVFVGVTDGQLAGRPSRQVSSWARRAQRVEEFVRGPCAYKGALKVSALADAAGPAATGAYDRIVVSPETEPGARRINGKRQEAGLKPLAIVVVPHVLGEDLLPLSATAVHAGLVDPHGKRLKPVRVVVGSANDVKVAAVRQEFVRILPLPAEVRGFAVHTNVPEQPRDGETLAGARNRAKAALAAWPEADYAIGIEAGLVRFPAHEGHLEAQACVVLDRAGLETHGWGPAFHYPAFVTSRAAAGEMVSDILGPIANDPRMGSTTGAIGYLTEGRLDRTALSRMAVLMAFVPRFRRDLYARTDPTAGRA